MGVVFLVYYNAAGGEVLAALPVESGRGTFYLPNQPAGTEIDLALELDPQHSSLCLEVDPGCVLLRVFDETDGSCSVLNDDGSEFEIPLSSSLHHKSLIIRGDEHFLSPAGRWAVRWDDEQGTVWNSMRPPSLPLVTLDQEASPEEEHLKEILQEEDICSAISPVRPDRPKGDIHGEQIATNTESPENDVPPSRNENFPATMDTDRSELTDPCADLTSAGPPSKVQSPSPKSSQHSTGPVQELTSNADDRLTNGSQDDSVRIEAHEVGTAALSAAEILDLQDSNVDIGFNTSEMPTTERNMVEGRATEEAGHQVVEIVEAGDKPEATTAPPLSPQEDEAVLDHSPTASPAAAGRLSKKRKLRQDEDTEETRFMADDPEIVASTAHEDRRHIAHSSPPQTPRKMVQMGHNRKPKPIQDEEQGEARVYSNDPTAQEDEKAVTESSPPLGHHGTSNGAESSNDADLSATERPTKKRKLVHIALGLDVVTEQWITESVDKGRLVNVRKFLPNDPTREQQWSFNLKQALARGKQGLTCLLAGTTVCFTKQLKTDLGSLDRELSQIATILGAEAVKHRLPALKDKDKHDENELLFIGVPNDPQGAHVGRLGHKLYNKDILTMGALRGQIEREFSEFILEVPVKAEDED
ncbi:hypothetical protein KCU88_g2126, partial [Aureobasidium melanogenum]